MIASSLVVIYRGSGVVNFAQGAFVMVAGYVYYETRVNAHWPTWAGVVVAILAVTVLSLIVQVVSLQGMRRASGLARVMVTLAFLVIIQAVVYLRYQNNVLSVPSLLPIKSVPIGSAYIGLDRIILIVIGIVVTLALWLLYKFTPLGRMTTAVAENPSVLSSSGHSPDKIAAANWAIGGLLSGIAGVLIAPISGLSSALLPLVVLPTLAAAVVGGFASFPIALVSALVIGVAEAEILRYVTDPGWSQSVPFLLVIAFVVLKGRALPLRSYVLERLPAVGTGKIRPIPVIVCVVVAYLLISFWLQGGWLSAFVVSMAVGIIGLSIVVVTGYAGQISLSQYVLGGGGALVATKLAAARDWDLAVVLLVVFAVGAVAGVIVGIPALRTRGVNLAIVTLGFGIVVYSLFLTRPSLTGGVDGLPVPPLTFFGWDVNPLLYPSRYGLVVLALLVVFSLMTANLRRGAVGRRLLALRGSERAAVASGVNVFATKLYAFGLASGYATVGATLLAFMNPSVLASQFDVMSSISIVTGVVIGGVGLIPGALLGGTAFATGLGNSIFESIGLGIWLPLVAGLTTLFVLRSAQSGLVVQNVEIGRAIYRSARRLATQARRRPAAEQAEQAAPAADTATPARGVRRFARRKDRSATALPAAGGERLSVTPLTLRVQDVSVRFGGVQALKDVSLTVAPRTIHGLIGPNGAGKTTFVDVVTGFVKGAQGSVVLGERDVSTHSALRRAREGVRRSFQSVELFDDLTVLENVVVGSDSGRLRDYVSGLCYAGAATLSREGVAAVREFDLAAYLDSPVDSLSFGRRRLVSIARAMASGPSVMLLDEPASGLDPGERAELAELIRRMAYDWGMAVLLIEHDVDMVWSLSDEVTVLVGGSVLTSGPTEQVRTSPLVREAYMGIVDEPDNPLDEQQEEVPEEAPGPGRG
jgi:sulfate-transporting ATPase